MFLFRIRSEGYRRSNGNRKAGNGGEKTCLRSLNVVSILVTASGAKGRITFGSRFRHDFFPSSLIVFFVIREESHHSFNRSMTSTIFRTKKKRKKKKRVIIEIIAILFLFIYFFLFLRRWFYNLWSSLENVWKYRRKEKYIDCSFFLY